jgi:hypothetical protein
MVTTPKRKIWLWFVTIAILATALVAVRSRQRLNHPIVLRCAIIKQNDDPRNQSPIADVLVSAANAAAIGDSKTDFSGLFTLTLKPDIISGEHITLSFQHPDYQPLALDKVVSDQLYVIRLIPVHGESATEPNKAETTITNVLVRYSREAITTENIGSGVRTFQVVNTGNVPCNKRPPCSPDGKWKAELGSATLDAGAGNVFRNARVTCIAGPCPFSRIDTDEFTRGGRNIKVTVLNWSDTTTYLLQAEVFRPQVGDIVRASYPVIFGRAMNFTLPATAEGLSIEAELNGTRIIFPLGPHPILSWAVCNVRVESNQAKDYRCELKTGFQFR